ncbi:LysR family transcriptional regulator [Paenibacillus filicis]|uniref:LysR family transcriptional regulator n=1 Tax=Paenibacillus gyeongsangnamensis TaxID=3388067 RepID=A0ABT4Q3V9_9BACL|nr:LysR family transcriptional regulator [Paenibacillus filicis]MCZ8511565.1 LysR family transcriptional regulator [Paenibacillus filicis]
MELRQLEYFIAVCEELHVTKAAEKLGISQPTLSLQLRAMEEELGTLVFDRIGKRIALTEAGMILLKYARRMVQDRQNALLEIKELREFQGGNLVVGVLPAELDYRITPLFIDYHRNYPKVSLKIISSVEIPRLVLANEADIGITLIQSPDPRLVTRPLYSESFVLVVSEKHELADRDAVSLLELKGIPMVMYPSDFMGREVVENRCRAFGFQLDVAVETTTAPSLFNFVRSNIGATVQPLDLSKSLNDPTLRLITIEDHTPTREIGIIYRADKYLGFAARKCIEFIEHQLKRIK